MLERNIPHFITMSD